MLSFCEKIFTAFGKRIKFSGLEVKLNQKCSEIWMCLQYDFEYVDHVDAEITTFSHSLIINFDLAPNFQLGRKGLLWIFHREATCSCRPQPAARRGAPSRAKEPPAYLGKETVRGFQTKKTRRETRMSRKYKMRKNVELRGMINQYEPIKLLRTQKMHGTLYENTININNLSKFIIGQIMAWIYQHSIDSGRC